MPALENRIAKTIITGVVATVLVTMSLLSAMAAPTAKVGATHKAAITKTATTKTATTKTAVVKKARVAKKAHLKAAIVKKGAVKKSLVKAAANEPTVLDEIVIEKTPVAAKGSLAFADKIGSANPAFRKHFFRGQAGIA